MDLYPRLKWTHEIDGSYSTSLDVVAGCIVWLIRRSKDHSGLWALNCSDRRCPDQLFSHLNDAKHWARTQAAQLDSPIYA